MKLNIELDQIVRQEEKMKRGKKELNGNQAPVPDYNVSLEFEPNI